MTRPAPLRAATALVDRARREPARVVAADATGRVTATELDRAASAVAGLLVESTDASGWIPILVDRSVGSVVAFHGALRAGRRFALIDATLPAAAVAGIVQRLGPVPLVLAATPAAAAQAPSGPPVVTVPGAVSAGRCCEPQSVDPTEAGEVLFTSGSTGRPKGVVRAWRSFERIFVDQTEGRIERVLVGEQFALLRPPHFSAAANALVAAALGATIHVLDPLALGLDRLLAEFCDRCIDSFDGPTGLVLGLVRTAANSGALSHLAAATLGGEPVPWELIADLRAVSSPRLAAMNRFGSSESGACFGRFVAPDEPIGTGDLALGRPSDPSRVRLVPVEPGSGLTELVVRDPDGLGYLDDPAETARCFVTEADGSHWWRSGDIVHRDDEGAIRHLGRVDDVVKINGVRVAPLESERAVRSVPGVADAIVLPHELPSGRRRLVAHVRVTDPSLSTGAVLDHVRDRVAGALVPSVFVRHDELPYLGTGKVDRQALLAAPLVPWGVADTPRRPATELEWTMCGLAAELLEVASIGPDENLWLLGMDSLGAVELCASLAAQGLGDLDPRTLLSAATPAELARRLGGPGAFERDVVVLHPDGREAPVFVLPGAGQTALGLRALARAIGTDHPVVVIEAHGLHARGRPDRTVEAMAARAAEEIRRYLGAHAGDECVVAGHSGGATIAYEIGQQRRRVGLATRVVLIDPAPGVAGSVRGPSAALAAGPAPSAVGRLGTHRWRELPRVLGRQLEILWFRTVPTRPRARPMRYVAFGRRCATAVRRYEARPAEFRCSLLHIETSHSASRLAPLVPDLVVQRIGGDHRSCVEYPHSLDVAAAIAAELEQVGRS